VSWREIAQRKLESAAEGVLDADAILQTVSALKTSRASSGSVPSSRNVTLFTNGKEISLDKLYEEGMKVRRKILGDAHVDRAIKNTTAVTQEFQDFIVRSGWGEVWTRPGFDHRTRRILVLGTMMGIGRWEEFKMHLRAALEGQMSIADIKEIFLQQAIYCGVPVANTAFHHLEDLIAELKAKGVPINGLEE
jgi:4-carboxymuconolactone decarboxylase